MIQVRQPNISWLATSMRERATTGLVRCHHPVHCVSWYISSELYHSRARDAFLGRLCTPRYIHLSPVELRNMESVNCRLWYEVGEIVSCQLTAQYVWMGPCMYAEGATNLMLNLHFPLSSWNREGFVAYLYYRKFETRRNYRLLVSCY